MRVVEETLRIFVSSDMISVYREVGLNCFDWCSSSAAHSCKIATSLFEAYLQLQIE